MDKHVDENRENVATIAVLGEAARSAAYLHSALIATCHSTALVIVERTGQNEGLEACRELLRKYEPRSKQTKVMRLLEVLTFNFKDGALLDSLEGFERAVAQYEKEAKKKLDDDIKVGVVIKGIATGSLKEHLLLHSEKTDSYDEFRGELDTIARHRPPIS